MANRKEALDHALLALDLLTHHQVNLSLLKKIHVKLDTVIKILEGYSSNSEVTAKNMAQEILFYQNLVQSIERDIQNENLVSVRWIEKSLKHHLLKKDPENPFLHHLLSIQHDWIPDTIAE